MVTTSALGHYLSEIFKLRSYDDFKYMAAVAAFALYMQSPARRTFANDNRHLVVADGALYVPLSFLLHVWPHRSGVYSGTRYKSGAGTFPDHSDLKLSHHARP